MLNIIYIELFKIQYKINWYILGGNVTDISLIAQEGLIVFINASKTSYRTYFKCVKNFKVYFYA